MITDILFVIFVIILLFIGIGYELIINFLTKNKNFKRVNKLIPVTIIIPTYNEEKFIKQKLQNIFSLNYPKKLLNIIVSDSNSTDKTIQIAKKFPVKIIQINEPGKIKAINMGIKKSKTDLVVMTDADTIMDKDAIKNSISLIGGDIGAVNAIIRMKRRKLWYMKGKMKYHNKDWNMRHKESILHSCCGLDGKFILFNKKIIDKIPENSYVDVFELTFCIIKKGYRCVVDDKTIVYEIPPANYKEEIKQMKRRTVLTILTLFRHLDVLFNKKFSYFGMLILPFRRFFVIFIPFMLIYIFIFLFLKIGFWIFIFFVTILNENIFYFMLISYAVFFAWLDIILDNYSKGAIWSKINQK